MKTKKAEAKKLLRELKESISKRSSHFDGMSEEEAMKHMRKIREQLWEKKLAARS